MSKSRSDDANNSKKGRAEVVSITLWCEDIAMHALQGYECYAVETESSKEFFHFGVFQDQTSKSKVTLFTKTAGK